MLSYLFNAKMNEKELIKKLETYRALHIESLDFQVGDYIVAKPDADSFNPHDNIYYVLDMNKECIAVTSHHNTLCIDKINPCYYQKLREEQKPPLLEEFVNDRVVAKDVVSGVIVRNRLHYCQYNTTNILQQPMLIMDNKNGDITVVAQVENAERVIEKTFKWYELAYYY